VRYLLASTALAASFVACTETPSSFPPCIYTAPCPDSGIVDDGGSTDGVSTDVGSADGASSDGPDGAEGPDAGSNADAPIDDADGE
jgi:hypothetical protein